VGPVGGRGCGGRRAPRRAPRPPTPPPRSREFRGIAASPEGPQRRLCEFSGGGDFLVATRCCSAIRPSTGKMFGLGFNSWPSPIIFGREFADGDLNTKHPLCEV